MAEDSSSSSKTVQRGESVYYRFSFTLALATCFFLFAHCRCGLPPMRLFVCPVRKVSSWAILLVYLVDLNLTRWGGGGIFLIEG